MRHPSLTLMQLHKAFSPQVCAYTSASGAAQMSYRWAVPGLTVTSAMTSAMTSGTTSATTSTTTSTTTSSSTHVPALSHVLMHGIGSGSASWVKQLQWVSDQDAQTPQTPHTGAVLAWDAPGYGQSTPLSDPEPSPQDYGVAFWEWLDAFEASRDLVPFAQIEPLTLVGHSLGCLMATAAVLARPERVKRLVLLAPAIGYGASSEALRASKRDERLHNLQLLGPKGMADKRGHAMLHEIRSSQTASELAAFQELLEYVKHIMAQVTPSGYTQATHMLANADLLSLVGALPCPLAVASGDADVITPLASCQTVAAAGHAPHLVLSGSGHACHLQSAQAVIELLFNKSAVGQAA